ncbi:hypothetical protein [Methylobacterium sp. A54F]
MRSRSLPVLAAALSAALLVPLAAAPAAARPGWASGTFVYADLCAGPEGVAGGYRVTLRRSPNGDGVVYEAGQGGAPVRAGAVRFDDAHRAVSFSAETKGGPVAFEGTATTETLTGTLREGGGARTVSLPRVLRAHDRQPCGVEATGTLATGTLATGTLATGTLAAGTSAPDR